MVLLGARDSRTREVRFPPPEFLQGGRTAEPVSMGTHGTVYTYTTVHPRNQPPYSLGMVDFENGLRVFGRLVSPDGTAPRIGEAVRVVAFSFPDGTPDFAFESARRVAA